MSAALRAPRAGQRHVDHQACFGVKVKNPATPYLALCCGAEAIFFVDCQATVGSAEGMLNAPRRCCKTGDKPGEKLACLEQGSHADTQNASCPVASGSLRCLWAMCVARLHCAADRTWHGCVQPYRAAPQQQEPFEAGAAARDVPVSPSRASRCPHTSIR
eukprot:gene12938-biopygen3473